MLAALSFVQQVRQRLRRHTQLNIVGYFVPLAISGWALGRLLLGMFAAPPLFAFLPPIVCGGLLGLALRKLRITLDPTAVASLLDDALAGKERFLTLVTVAVSDSGGALSPLIEQQAEQLAVSFRPKRDLALTIDKRVPWAIGAALGSVLLLVFWPSPDVSTRFSLSPVVTSPGTPSRSQEQAIATLEETARRLLAPTATPQEQMTGAQLLSLVQQLKDPSLTPQEKQQQLEGAQKRFSLNSPLPQIFPLDLKIFAGKGKDEKGQRDENDASQSGNTPLEKAPANPGQSEQSPSSTGAGNDPQPGSLQDGEKQKQPRPRQDGGSLAFNFPQPEGKNQKQSPQESSSATSQKPAQPQPPDSRAPGADPNRPGAGQNNQAQNIQGKDPNKPDPRQGQKNEKSEGGTSVGMSKGEHVPKPGEQTGGGFLTKDARFVKVRVPVAQEAQAEEDGRAANSQRATPKTPYSNAPFKEGQPEQAHLKQPIPLEYRSILAE